MRYAHSAQMTKPSPVVLSANAKATLWWLTHHQWRCLRRAPCDADAHKQDRTCRLIIEHEQAETSPRSSHRTITQQQQHRIGNSSRARPDTCSVDSTRIGGGQEGHAVRGIIYLTCSGRDVLRAADRCWAPTNEDEDTTKACAGASSATAVATEAETFMTTAVVLFKTRKTSWCCRGGMRGTASPSTKGGPLLGSQRYRTCTKNILSDEGGGGEPVALLRPPFCVLMYWVTFASSLCTLDKGWPQQLYLPQFAVISPHRMRERCNLLR